MIRKMTIAIGSDHGGYDLKTQIMDYLNKEAHVFKDFGTHDSNTSVDYTDYGLAVAKAVAHGECHKGIVICGTGLGISIAANKVPGIRAALCTDTYMARMSREHNNANILALGARVTGSGLVLEIVEMWLKTPFTDNGRHLNRIAKIAQIEREYR